MRETSGLHEALLTRLGASVSELVDSVRRSVVVLRGPHGSVGSGVVWRSDGTVVTNAHVVRGGVISVELPGGEHVVGDVVRVAPERDLAVVRVREAVLTPARVGDATRLRPGEVVLALGTPLGVPGAATLGVVSGVSPAWRLPDGRRSEAIIAHVALRPGNSGGPLLDARGGVVGVNTLAMGPKTGVAIPSHVAEALLDGPTLGVSGRLVGLASPWQERFGAATGILVDAVAPGSLADRAGMRRGDVLVAVDGEAATGVVDLARLLARRAGRVVELTVLRESGLRSLEVLVPA